MMARLSQPGSINVLLTNANWAWPQAVAQIFQPRGINALVANSAAEMVRIVTTNKIHLAILDQATNDLSGMHTLKIIRNRDALIPCIVLAQHVDDHMLREALALKAFSVLAKPIDLELLVGQIDRLFTKYYASDVFST